MTRDEKKIQYTVWVFGAVLTFVLAVLLLTSCGNMSDLDRCNLALSVDQDVLDREADGPRPKACYDVSYADYKDLLRRNQVLKQAEENGLG